MGNHKDVGTMASKADNLWFLHYHQQHGLVASVDPVSSTSQPSATIAAVKTGLVLNGGHSSGQRGKGSACGGAAAVVLAKAVSTSSPSVTPDSMARVFSSLCYFHCRFGDRVTRFESVHLAGKLASGGTTMTLPPVIWSTSGIRYPDTGIRCFLVDTGASYSIFPHWSSSLPTGHCLLTPQEQKFPVGVKKNLGSHLITNNSMGPSLSRIKFSNFVGGFSATPTPAGRSSGERLVSSLTAPVATVVNPQLPPQPSLATYAGILTAGAAIAGPEQPSPEQPAPDPIAVLFPLLNSRPRWT